MKSVALALLSLLVFSLLVNAQERGRSTPPGLREAQKHRLVLDPPMAPQRRHIDPARLQRDAQELAELARSVPPEIEQVNKGVLPKEVLEKLKKIEKLSKRLRNDLAP